MVFFFGVLRLVGVGEVLLVVVLVVVGVDFFGMVVFLVFEDVVVVSWVGGGVCGEGVVVVGDGLGRFLGFILS